MKSSEATGTSGEPSRLRLELRRRFEEMAGLLDMLSAPEPLFRWQVYEAMPKCGKPTCHCATGEGHRAILVSFLDGKRRKTRAIDEATRSQLEPPALRYREFRKARARWVRLAKEIPALLNDLERARALPPEELPLRQHGRDS